MLAPYTRVAAALAVGLGLTACNLSVIMRGTFEPVGEIGALPSGGEPLEPEEVRVFAATAPDGFTLRDNELEVEEGYGHRVLGIVRAIYRRGNCLHGGPTSSRDVYSVLQEAAAAEGADAVIYATSRIPPDATPTDICQADGDYGQGWAVLLGSAPSEPNRTADDSTSGGATESETVESGAAQPEPNAAQTAQPDDAQ